MTELDDLIAAVEAGRYDRESGTPRYFDFAVASDGILPGTLSERASIYLGGRNAALGRLRAYRATRTANGDA